jgi:hypothetical protein
VPVNIDEDTNRLVKGVVELADPSLKLGDQDISISHCLPASTGFIAPIIAKFTRRDVRDRIISMKSLGILDSPITHSFILMKV